jgi:hypothetical protein
VAGSSPAGGSEKEHNMSNEKKKDKRIAHAEMVWEREQLQAAMAVEKIDKSLFVIEEYKDELTDEQIEQVRLQVANQRKEIETFLMAARDKFAKKLDEYNLEAVIADRHGLDLSKARSMTLEVE